MSKILKKSGMAPKFIQICGDSGEENKQLGSAMLGVGYDCPDDMIRFSFPATYQKKDYRGGSKVKEEISKKDLQLIRAGRGTRCLRTVLLYIMGQYDPLGLCSPILNKKKLLLQRTHKAAAGWDQSLPQDIKKEWGSLMKELQEAGTVFFPTMHKF